jgi:branched-chain amino acid aminotransferase
MAGSQDFRADPRNASVRVWLNGALVPREEAKVSILDAGFVLGDGVWEGVRLHKGKLVFLDAHLDRLFEGAAAIDLDIGLARADVVQALWATLRTNGMEDGVHIRLMVTRGLKKTPNQDPRQTIGPATIAIIAEWKQPSADLQAQGLTIFTSSIRCSPADMFDMRLNSHSRLNLITALIQAIKAGADEALMLDLHGFISSCNATNLFWVRAGHVFTSTGDYCFHGVTRANVIALCRANAIAITPGNFVLKDIYNADEAFVTGTFGGLTPVRGVDGRVLPGALPGSVTARLSGLYNALKDSEAEVTV